MSVKELVLMVKACVNSMFPCLLVNEGHGFVSIVHNAGKE